MDTFDGILHGERNKAMRKTHVFQFLTMDELRQLNRVHIYYVPELPCPPYDSAWVYRVRITSIKTWKRKPDIEVHWQYGLYRFGYETVVSDSSQWHFVKEVK
jgi:hypothetical protein